MPWETKNEKREDKSEKIEAGTKKKASKDKF